MSDTPSRIRAYRSQSILELAWDDPEDAPPNQIDRIPYRFLRGQCPCAACVHELTGERIIDLESIPDDIQLEGMETIGNYAVRLVWSDGHSSGLFTWEQLRRLGAEAPTNDD